ncbi:hypothetical protein ACLB2K_055953 [Fragaria x ananassa]
MLELHKQSGGKTGDFKSGYEQSMEQNFYNPLWTLFGKQMVFIPLHHGSSLHYTLLLIDNINKCFYHMNSLLPKPYKEKDNYHFKNAKAVVKHIKEFIKRIHYTTVFTLSQDLDQNEYREDYAIDYAPEDSQGRKKSNIVKMTDDEKKDVIEHETMLELHKQSGGKTGDFKSGYEQSMEQNFYNPLWTLFGKQMVFIPLHHGSSLHYTLLLIDNINKCFYHMNSLLPKPYKEKDNYHFKNAKAVVKHIKEFIKRIHYTTVFTLSQDLDQNEYREDYAIDYAPEDSQGRKKSNIVKMTDDEKVTRRWIIDNNIHNKPYKLTEHRTCPQQNVSSSDCGPFVLHYMEAMCAGLDPNQEGGNQMRKKMLEEFAKLN